MKKIFLPFLFSIISILNYGQDSLQTRKELNSLEIGLGASCLSDEYVMVQQQQWGVSASLRLRFEAKNQKYAITPMLGIRNYVVAVNNEEFDNVLLALRIGVILDVNLYKNLHKDLLVSNFLELCYSNYRNFLRQEAGTSTVYTSTGPRQQTDYDTKTLYRGEAPSIVIGYKLKYKMFFMDIGYDIVKSHIRYDGSLLNSLRAANPEMDEHPGTIFNSFNLHCGLSVPFSKLNTNWFYL